MTDRPPLLKLTGAEFPRLEDTEWGKRHRPMSDECRLGYPEACTDVANPTQAPRDRGACHETFVGLAAFDAHWLGSNDDRQCWPPDDLKGEWWRDERGYWHKGPKLTDEQKADIWKTYPTTEEN